MKKTAATFAIAIFGFGAAAQAATITQSQTVDYFFGSNSAGTEFSGSAGDSVLFDQFDPNDGTLTDITLQWEVDLFQASANVENTSDDPITVTLNLDGDFLASIQDGANVTGLLFFEEDAQGTETIPGNSDEDVSVSTSGGDSTSISNDFWSLFIGQDDVEIDLDTDVEFNIENGETIQASGARVDTEGPVTLTYMYETTAIPSPATLPAGLMLMGLVAARRPRRQRQRA